MLVLVAAGPTSDRIEPPAERVNVVMTELEPFVTDEGGRAGGFYAEIWDVVAAELRMTRSEAPLTTLDEARGQPVGVVQAAASPPSSKARGWRSSGSPPRSS